LQERWILHDRQEHVAPGVVHGCSWRARRISLAAPPVHGRHWHRVPEGPQVRRPLCQAGALVRQHEHQAAMACVKTCAQHGALRGGRLTATPLTFRTQLLALLIKPATHTGRPSGYQTFRPGRKPAQRSPSTARWSAGGGPPKRRW
jgi:hypothetical protein